MNKKDISDKYSIPLNTLSTILKIERPEISTEFQPDRKREQISEKADVGQTLFQFFKQARAMSAPISNPVLAGQAELIASELGGAGFTATVGWIESFRRRHGTALRRV